VGASSFLLLTSYPREFTYPVAFEVIAYLEAFIFHPFRQQPYPGSFLVEASSFLAASIQFVTSTSSPPSCCPFLVVDPSLQE